MLSKRFRNYWYFARGGNTGARQGLLQSGHPKTYRANPVLPLLIVGLAVLKMFPLHLRLSRARLALRSLTLAPRSLGTPTNWNAVKGTGSWLIASALSQFPSPSVAPGMVEDIA